MIATTTHQQRGQQRERLAQAIVRLSEIVRSEGSVQALVPCLSTITDPQAIGPLSGAPQVVDLVHLAMSSRRVDLLNAVLSMPAFQASARTLGLVVAMAHPDPSVRPWASESTASLSFENLETLTDALPRPSEIERTWRLLQTRQPMLAGFRVHSHTNMVGLAVMMGWREGLRSLLDHGVDPYGCALHTSRSQLLSPVMLAVHQRDPVALACLIEHASWDLARRYGFDAMAWALADPSHDDRSLVLAQRPTPGGLELDAVLDDTALVQDARVGQALAQACEQRFELGRMPQALKDLKLTPERQRTLEGVLLRRTATQTMALGSMVRPRSRL